MTRQKLKKKFSPPAGIGPNPPPPARKPPGRPPAPKVVLHCVFLFLLVVFVFAGSLNNSFVNYDDEDYVTANGHVQAGLTGAGVEWAFTSSDAANWHPLTWISHMLDCQFHGLNPRGHHLTSVLLHAVNTVLVFLVLRYFTGSIWRSFVVAALFGLHPLRVESVAWVSERKDVLSGLFWMLSLLAYGRYAMAQAAGKAKLKVFYGLSLLFFACGLMSKPMVVTLPFVLLLLDFWPLNRFRRDRVVKLVMEKIPFFVLVALASATTFAVQKHANIMSEGMPLSYRLENGLVAYCRYIGKLFWPVHLAVFYPHPIHWPVGLVILSGTGLLLFTGLVIALWRRYPWLPVGWGWYLGTLVPVIGIVQVGAQSMADRYSYIPSIGVLIIVVWGVHAAVKHWAVPAMVPAGAATLAILASIGITVHQIGYWRNSETLFSHALAVTTGNFVAHNNLGRELAEQGNSDEAVAHYEEALKIKPDYPEALNNLGNQFAAKGRPDAAADYFRQAIQLMPNVASFHSNLGGVLSDQGKFDAAIQEFREAAALQPDNARAQHNWGLALMRKGLSGEAILHYREALRLQPAFFEAHNNLGIALYEKDQFDEAIVHFQAALKLRPADSGVAGNLQAALERKAALARH